MAAAATGRLSYVRNRYETRTSRLTRARKKCERALIAGQNVFRANGPTVHCFADSDNRRRFGNGKKGDDLTGFQPPAAFEAPLSGSFGMGAQTTGCPVIGSTRTQFVATSDGHLTTVRSAQIISFDYFTVKKNFFDIVDVRATCECVFVCVFVLVCAREMIL